MAEAIRCKDWSQTPLGPIHQWSAGLRIAITTLLDSPLPTIVLWGPELLQIYNDAYRPILGFRHPAALGQATHACWPEVWQFNQPIYQQVIGLGQPVHLEDQAYAIEPSGVSETRYFTVTYAPLRDEGGKVSGVSVIAGETTKRVLMERENQASQRAYPEVATRGLVKILDDSHHSGETLPASDQLVSFAATKEALNDSGNTSFADSYLDFIFKQSKNAQGQVSGIFVSGSDVSGQRQARMALSKNLQYLQAVEVRHAFQLALADRLRPLTDPKEVTAAACEMLGKHLGVSRVVFYEVNDVLGTFFIRSEWTQAPLKSIAGTRGALNDFGLEHMTVLRSGHAAVNHDVTLDPLTANHAETFTQLGIRAVLAVPLVKSGALTVVLSLHHPRPHHWTDAEIALAKDTAERTWSAAESTRAQAELRLLAVAVSRLNDIVLITEAEPLDEPGPRIVSVNEAFERLTGYTQAEVIGKTPRFLQGPKTQRAELDRIRQALQKWQPVRAELINYTKNGEEFWLELDIVPIADANGWFTHWVSVERDISERKKTEQAILLLNSELEDRVQLRTQQLEAANAALESFSYSVSHDLRSPLNTINGFSQLLLRSDGAHLSEKGRHYLERIRAASTNMGELINGLLSLAKISSTTLARSDVNLTTMSFNLVQELKDSEPDRIVDVHIQGDLVVNGHPEMMAVAMQNLIGNAWKYSAKTPNARVEIGSETLESGVTCIFVRDNGVGFDMAHADEIFEVFQRLHRHSDFTGTGIGLANVKRVVERHGGRVWAEAKPDEGAIFRFTLAA